MSAINYAHAYGIHSLGAAIFFAVIYAPFVPFYLFRSIRNPTFVYFMLTFFCAIRVAAFTLRSVLAGSESAAEKLDVLITNQVIYNVGFFGVLYSVYTLVLDRQLLAGIELHNPLTYITGNRHIIRMALTAAVAVGIVGAIDVSSTDLSSQKTGKTLRTVGIVIYLVVVVLLLAHTLLYINARKNANNYEEKGSFGRENGTPILFTVIILLLIREIFYVSTVDNLSQQTNEKLFYSLSALPEFLAVILLAAPGLVPSKAELPPSNETGIMFLDLFNSLRERRESS